MTAILILKIFVMAKIVEYFIFFILNILNLLYMKENKIIPSFVKDSISDEEYFKSQIYTIAKTRYGILSTSFDLTVLFLFIFFNGFFFAEQLTLKLFDSPEIQAVFFCFLIGFGKEIIDIPINLYYHFSLEEKFGFNKMTYSVFIKDFFKKLLLTFLFGAPLIFVLFKLIIKTNDLWWIYGFIFFSLFQLFILWVYPTWIAPLFNKFIPLPKGELRDEIMAISKNINFPISEIFQMDGSKRSAHSNAYFTGFGKNRRIVLFDTLINSLTKNELVAVLAHEMAHNKLKHIQQSIIISFTMSFIGFYIWSILINYKPLYNAFSLSGTNLFPALIIFPLIMGPVSFFLEPFFNMLSRRNEYQADSFAAKNTGSKEHIKNALLKLNKENLSNLTPHPYYSFYYYSHPALEERIKAIDNES